jgi:hypothetical protein
MSYRIILTIFLLTLQYLYAQEDEFKDIVVLSNGVQVIGKITEILPGEQVTIQTRIGSTFTFKANQIKTVSQYGKPNVMFFTKPTNDTVKKAQQLPPPKVDSSKAQTDKPAKPKIVWDQTPKRSTPQQYYEPVYESTDEQNFRINIEGGYSYRTAKISSDIPAAFKSYMEKLKSGYNIAANISYFFNEEYGVCLGYSRFMTSNSMDGVYIYDPAWGDTYGPGIMEDDITISYLGIGMAGRKIFSDGNILLIGNFSLGMASYTNDSKLIGSTFKIEGSTFAYSGLLSLDFMLDRNWALGFGISYLGGTLKDAKVNGRSAKLGEENLFRFDFNVGIKYYF